jgi:hypothetical protein
MAAAHAGGVAALVMGEMPATNPTYVCATLRQDALNDVLTSALEQTLYSNKLLNLKKLPL